MAGQPAEKKTHFTWEDYQTWPEGERAEIVAGDVFDMSSAPLARHQYVVARLAGVLESHLRVGPCQMWIAPMSVRLSDEDVVEPDLFVVCDPRQVRRTHIEGPPRLVVEILSEASLRHDRIRKFQLYQRSGVLEYWIVNPYPSLIEVFVLDSGHYRLHAGFEKHETLTSPTFPGLRVDLSPVFGFPLEPGESVERVRERRPPYGRSASSAAAGAPASATSTSQATPAS